MKSKQSASTRQRKKYEEIIAEKSADLLSALRKIEQLERAAISERTRQNGFREGVRFAIQAATDSNTYRNPAS